MAYDSSQRDDTALLEFWSQSQPGFRFSSADIGTEKFFAEIEARQRRE
jgi:hypothetical protein